MERRILLKLIAAGFLAPAADVVNQGIVSIASLSAAPDGYKPQFFSKREMEALERLTEIVIPADDHSPGAKEALVNRYIDVMVGEADAAVRRSWKTGLGTVDSASKGRFGKAFRRLDAGQQEAIVAAMAENEGAPADALQRFFAQLKRMTIDGYYTSKIGIHDDLRYQGNTALAEFPGCTHPEHQQA